MQKLLSNTPCPHCAGTRHVAVDSDGAGEGLRFCLGCERNFEIPARVVTLYGALVEEAKLSTLRHVSDTEEPLISVEVNLDGAEVASAFAEDESGAILAARTLWDETPSDGVKTVTFRVADELVATERSGRPRLRKVAKPRSRRSRIQ